MGKLVKVEEFYKRDESKIKLCPAWVIYTMPLVFILMLVSVVLMVSGFRKTTGYIGLVLFLLSFFWSIFSDKIFSMYENCRVLFKEDCVVYKYDLNRSVMPSSNVTTTVTLSEISKIKVKRKTIVVKGRISRRAPLKKEVQIKKVELPIDFVERSEIVNKLKERVK